MLEHGSRAVSLVLFGISNSTHLLGLGIVELQSS